MHTLGSVAAVEAAVRDDAAAEAERIERAAEQAAARLRARAAPDDDAGVMAAREARLMAARREARERLAREDWLDARAALEDREGWLERAAAAGRALLRAPAPPAERRAELLRLVREAVAQLPGERFEVVLSPADAALLAAGMPSIRVVADPLAEPGACLARSCDGKAAFDNGIDARARRLESAWRAALGEIYGS